MLCVTQAGRLGARMTVRSIYCLIWCKIDPCASRQYGMYFSNAQPMCMTTELSSVGMLVLDTELGTLSI